MNVLAWHVHGGYMNAFVRGNHRYLVPTAPGRGPDGRGRSTTYDWPASVVEVTPAEAREAEVDVVVLQRPCELAELATAWMGGRVPGVDVPAVYLEHNTPPDPRGDSLHPAADRPDITVVHVTFTNALYWNTGSTRSVVVEHGVVDPGYQYAGELPRVAAAINEPARRGRVTGIDVVDGFRDLAPVDLFGMGTTEVGGCGELPQPELHRAMAMRRAYLHTTRWTSLGLSLLEAMHLGIPPVALATTDAMRAIPRSGGFLSNDLDVLRSAVRILLQDVDFARATGRCAREHALRRYGLRRFLRDWDRVLCEVAG